MFVGEASPPKKKWQEGHQLLDLVGDPKEPPPVKLEPVPCLLGDLRHVEEGLAGEVPDLSGADGEGRGRGGLCWAYPGRP